MAARFARRHSFDSFLLVRNPIRPGALSKMKSRHFERIRKREKVGNEVVGRGTSRPNDATENKRESHNVGRPPNPKVLSRHFP